MPHDSRPASWSHIPGFRSWLRAFMSTIYLIPIAFALPIIRQLSYPVLLFSFGIENDHLVLMQIKIVLFFLGLGILWVVIPTFFLAHVHQFLWGEPDPRFPRWMPNRKSQREGFWDCFVITLSLLLCIGCFVAGYIVECHGTRLNFCIPRRLEEQEAYLFFVLFFLFAAQIYHIILSLQNFVKRITANRKRQ